MELIAAIRAAYQHESYVDPRVAGKLMTSFDKRKNENDLLGELSPREKVVLYWLAQGYSNIEVAEKTVLSEKTVKNHVSHMLKKLELRGPHSGRYSCLEGRVRPNEPRSHEISRR